MTLTYWVSGKLQDRIWKGSLQTLWDVIYLEYKGILPQNADMRSISWRVLYLYACNKNVLLVVWEKRFREQKARGMTVLSHNVISRLTINVCFYLRDYQEIFLLVFNVESFSGCFFYCHAAYRATKATIQSSSRRNTRWEAGPFNCWTYWKYWWYLQGCQRWFEKCRT